MLEVVASQQVNIYADQARRRRGEVGNLLDPRATFVLFDETVIRPDHIRFPFQFRVNYVQGKWWREHDVNMAAMLAVYPYALCNRLSISSGIFKEPAYGADVLINIAALDDDFSNVPGFLGLTRSLDCSPRMLVARFLLFHEWAHLVSINSKGSDLVSMLTLDKHGHFHFKDFPQEEAEADNFAVRELESLALGYRAPLLLRIPD